MTDPMDLGPFLQEYVLRNPFENLPNGTPPGLTGKKKPTSENRVVTQSPTGDVVLANLQAIKRQVNPSPSVSIVNQSALIPPSLIKRSPPHETILSSIALTPLNNNPTKCGLTSVKVEKHAGYCEDNDECEDVNCEEEEEDGEQLIEEHNNRDDDDGGDEDYVEENKSSTMKRKLLDTPKAHIGSNANYATALKELKLPAKHLKVKRWLKQNYKHDLTHVGYESADGLLKHVKTVFHEMKNSVLSRIMKFTFPECRKIINKYGYFYAGLLRRPSTIDVENMLLQRAVQAVNSEDLPLSEAAVKYGVTENQIASIIAWSKAKIMSKNLAAEIDGDLTSVEKQTPVNMFKQLISATQVSNKKTNSTGHKRQCITPSGIAKTRNKRKRGRPPKYHSDYVTYDPSAAEDSYDTPEKMLKELTGKEYHDKSQDSDSSDKMNGIHIKEEPVDVDYQICVSENKAEEKVFENGHPSSADSSVNARLRQSSNAENHKTLSNGTMLSSVVEVLSLKQELGHSKMELEEQKSENHTLEQKIDENNLEIAKLRDQLSTRETQLVNLSNCFFDLSNQFVHASQEFKRVMHSLQPGVSIPSLVIKR